MRKLFDEGNNVTRVCDVGMRVLAVARYAYLARSEGGMWVLDDTKRVPRAQDMRVLVYAEDHKSKFVRSDERWFAVCHSKHFTKSADPQWRSLRRSGPDPAPEAADACRMQVAVLLSLPSAADPAWKVAIFSVRVLQVGTTLRVTAVPTHHCVRPWQRACGNMARAGNTTLSGLRILAQRCAKNTFLPSPQYRSSGAPPASFRPAFMQEPEHMRTNFERLSVGLSLEDTRRWALRAAGASNMAYSVFLR